MAVVGRCDLSNCGLAFLWPRMIHLPVVVLSRLLLFLLLCLRLLISSESQVVDWNDLPQFVALSSSGSLTPVEIEPLRGHVLHLRDERSHGCAVPIGWTAFVSLDWTSCDFVQGLYRAGVEIASHTMDRRGFPSLEQIADAVSYLNETCRVPAPAGFRAPRYEYDSDTLQHLSTLPVIRYDSSALLSWSNSDEAPPMMVSTAAPWPFRWDRVPSRKHLRGQFARSLPEVFTPMADGHDARTNGNFSSLTQLWEIPVIALTQQEADAARTQEEPFQSLTNLLEQRMMHGNRAPLALDLTAPLISEAYLQLLAQWIRQILQRHSDVFFVTYAQLMEWMAHPLTAEEYSRRRLSTIAACFSTPPQMDCFPPAPDYTCPENMDWNLQTCQCEEPQLPTLQPHQPEEQHPRVVGNQDLFCCSKADQQRCVNYCGSDQHGCDACNLWGGYSWITKSDVANML